MIHQVPLDSGLKLLINYFTIIITVGSIWSIFHSTYAKYLAQELLRLSEESMSVSEEETQECVSCPSCVEDLVD